MCDEQKLYSDDYITIGQLNKLKGGNMSKNDPIQERISSYENRFNLLVQEIETDEILSKIEGNHLAGILIQMKKQIDDYLKRNK